MRYLVDTDVFLHDILHTERAEEAKSFLDEHSEEISTTILNLMEISSVLSRKYKWKKESISKVLDALKVSVEILIPTEYDMLETFNLSKERYHTPVDALMLSISKGKNSTLITFDSGILKEREYGFSVSSPSSIL
jgi:predicted nucleic acid-binding protein